MPEELLEYDAIILMDPDPSEIDDAWCRLVDTFVTEHAGGLLLTASRPRTPDFLRDPLTKALVDLLPVALDPEADLILNRIGHYQTKSRALEVPSEAGEVTVRTIGAYENMDTWMNDLESVLKLPVTETLAQRP